MPRRAAEHEDEVEVSTSANIVHSSEQDTTTVSEPSSSLVLWQPPSTLPHTPSSSSFVFPSVHNTPTSARTSSGWELTSQPSVSSLGRTSYLIVDTPSPQRGETQRAWPRVAERNRTFLASATSPFLLSSRDPLISGTIEMIVDSTEEPKNNSTTSEDNNITTSQPSAARAYDREELHDLVPARRVPVSEMQLTNEAPLEYILRNEDSSDEDGDNNPHGGGVQVRGGAATQDSDNIQWQHPVRQPIQPPKGSEAQGQQGFQLLKQKVIHNPLIRINAAGNMVFTRWPPTVKHLEKDELEAARFFAETLKFWQQEDEKKRRMQTAVSAGSNANDLSINQAPQSTVGCDSSAQSNNEVHASSTQHIADGTSQSPAELKMITEDGDPVVQMSGRLWRVLGYGENAVYQMLPTDPHVNSVAPLVPPQVVPVSAAAQQSLVPFVEHTSLQSVTNMQAVAQVPSAAPMQQIAPLLFASPPQPTASMEMMAAPQINIMPGSVTNQQGYGHGNLFGAYSSATVPVAYGAMYPFAQANNLYGGSFANVQPAVDEDLTKQGELLTLQNQMDVQNARLAQVDEQWAQFETSMTEQNRQANRTEKRNLVNHIARLRRKMVAIQSTTGTLGMVQSQLPQFPYSHNFVGALPTSTGYPAKTEQKISNTLSPNAPTFVPRGMSFETPDKVQTRRQNPAVQRSSNRSQVGPLAKQDLTTTHVNWQEVIFQSPAVTVDESEIMYCKELGWNDPAAPKKYCTTVREIEWVIKSIRLHAQKYGCKNGSSKDPAFDAEEDVRHAMHDKRPIPLAPIHPEFVQTPGPWEWKTSMFNVDREGSGWVPNSFSRIGAPAQVEARIDMFDNDRLKVLESKMKTQDISDRSGREVPNESSFASHSADRPRRDVSFATPSHKRNDSEETWNPEWEIRIAESTPRSETRSGKQREPLMIMAQDSNIETVPGMRAFAGDQSGLAPPDIDLSINDGQEDGLRPSLQVRRLPQVGTTTEERFWNNEKDPELTRHIDEMCAQPWTRRSEERQTDLEQNHRMAKNLFHRSKEGWQQGNETQSEKVFPLLESELASRLSHSQLLNQVQHQENHRPIGITNAASQHGNNILAQKSRPSLASPLFHARGIVQTGLASASAYMSSNANLSRQQGQVSELGTTRNGFEGAFGPNSMAPERQQISRRRGNRQQLFSGGSEERALQLPQAQAQINYIQDTPYRGFNDVSGPIMREPMTHSQDARLQGSGATSSPSAVRNRWEPMTGSQDIRLQDSGASSSPRTVRNQWGQTMGSQDVRLQGSGSNSSPSTARKGKGKMTPSQDVRLQGHNEPSRPSAFRNQLAQTPWDETESVQGILFYDAQLNGSRGGYFRPGLGEASGSSGSRISRPLEEPYPASSANAQQYHHSQPRGL
ncbi:hypothetical protein MMC13_001946 [Lambiella insularis]|nr:hypothetical protein [Lambiella insularis]